MTTSIKQLRVTSSGSLSSLTKEKEFWSYAKSGVLEIFIENTVFVTFSNDAIGFRTSQKLKSLLVVRHN